MSYSREDKEFAQRLANDLKASGAALWLDDDIIPGDPYWPEAVEKAIHNCSRVLVVLSPAAVASSFVKKEISMALKKQKTVIPVLHRECEIPLLLQDVQYVDFQRDYKTAVRRLLKALGVEDRMAVSELAQRAETAPASTPTEQPTDALETSAEQELQELRAEEFRKAERDRREREVAARRIYWIAGSVLVLIALAGCVYYYWTPPGHGPVVRPPPVEPPTGKPSPVNSIAQPNTASQGNAESPEPTPGGAGSRPDEKKLDGAEASGPEPAKQKKTAEARGYWVDPDTKLMWAKRDNGNDVNWRQAEAYCRDLKIAEYSGWTLPHLNELQRLRHRGWPRFRGGSPKGGIKTTGVVWSDTTSGLGETFAFGFGRGNQLSVQLDSSLSASALCVRRSGE